MGLGHLALLAALTTGSLYAQTALTPARAVTTWNVNGTVQSVSGFTSLSSPSSALSGTGSAGGGSDPGVSDLLHFIQGQTFLGTAEVESMVSYEFAVNGPAGQSVSIDFATSGFASAIGTGFQQSSTAVVQVAQAGSSSLLFHDGICVGNVPPGDCLVQIASGGADNFDDNTLLSVLTDTPYVVTIIASDSIVGPPNIQFPSATGSSHVDPTITLATTDPAYSLAFSSGLIAATPEPSSLVFLATALAAFPALRRRLLPSA